LATFASVELETTNRRKNSYLKTGRPIQPKRRAWPADGIAERHTLSQLHHALRYHSEESAKNTF
jgi:hypothetical protein